MTWYNSGFNPPKEKQVNEQAPSYNDGLVARRLSSEGPSPAWGRQAKAPAPLAAPMAAAWQPPPPPVTPPSINLFHSLSMMESVISELGEDVHRLYKRLDPVLGHIAMPDPIQDMDEDETDDSHMVKQMRRQQSRLATLRQLLAQIGSRLQLP